MSEGAPESGVSAQYLHRATRRSEPEGGYGNPGAKAEQSVDVPDETCPSECAEVNHPGLEHEEYLAEVEAPEVELDINGEPQDTAGGPDEDESDEDETEDDE